LYFSPEYIQKVIEKNDIVDVVSRYTSLKENRSGFVGLCPLHNEKTPSFMVSREKQVFYCFGCSKSGTLIHFIMERENLNFVDSIMFLSNIAGIDFLEYNDRESAVYEKKQEIYNLNNLAADYYFKILNSDFGLEGMEYLKKRKINDYSIEKFQVGYSTNDRNGLVNYLTKIGYDLCQIISAGLAVKKTNGSVWDVFFGRIIFPIIDIKKNIVGFGGRSLNETILPKYLNTSETLVFKKGQNLFGLNFAKENSCKSLIIVEGYTDVITLHQNKVVNSVACLGIAFTKEHLKLIKNYVDSVFLCYDSDEAGMKASNRAAEVLLNSNIKIKVIQIDNAKDVDEYIKIYGIDNFDLKIKNSLDYFEYKVNDFKKLYFVQTVNEKIKTLHKFVDFVFKIDDLLKREVYIENFSKELGISKKILFKEFEKQKILNNLKYKNKNLKKEGKQKIEKDSQLISAEKLLISLMFNKKNFEVISKKINPDDFCAEFHKKIAHTIYDFYKAEEDVNSAKFFSIFNQEEIPKIVEMLYKTKNLLFVSQDFDEKKQNNKIMQPIKIIKMNILKSRMNELATRGNIEDLNEIVKKLKEVDLQEEAGT
jgi:DNA primase